METTKIRLPRTALKALLLLAAKADIRYYLNAIRVEATNDATRLIATNGHILGLHHSAQQNNVPAPTAVTIPRRAIEIISPRAVERKRGDFTGVELIRDVGGWSLSDYATGLRIGFTEIEGPGKYAYPDYMGAIPKTVSGLVGNFNPEYIGVMDRVVKMLGNRRYGGFSMGHNGNSGALVTIASVPEFVGVVMPMRDDNPAKYPAFMEAPMSAKSPKPETVAA